jgi:peptidoglycan biosynthesis protein MviN/MurJ (putative lipid II flippase)
VSKKSTPQDNNERNWPLVIAFWLSLALILMFALVWHDKKAWSLEANEFGDFVAGFGSLLAFVWLVAATFLQMTELRLQREELKLQRQESEGLHIANREQAK